MDVIINAECTTIPKETKSSLSQGSALLNFLACLNYDTSNPPLADVLAQHHRLEGDWLILNPVQWEASHNNVILSAFGKDLGLDELEFKTLFHGFSDYLMSTGMALYYHDSYTWLLSSNHKSLLKAKPLYHMLNKPLFVELAQMDETMHWQKFLTESQMFFSSHHNQSLVNGVWLWGGGILKDKKNIRIATDQHFLPIAQLCSTAVSLYESTRSLNDFDLLLLGDISVLSKTHQEQLEKMTVRWHWNNLSYEYSPISWFTRLWRNLVHAH